MKFNFVLSNLNCLAVIVGKFIIYLNVKGLDAISMKKLPVTIFGHNVCTVQVWGI